MVLWEMDYGLDLDPFGPSAYSRTSLIRTRLNLFRFEDFK